MGVEILKLLEEVITGGGAFASLLTIILAGLLAGVGAYVGSYLRKKGEYEAIRQDFNNALQQLEQQTKVQEGIKHEFEALRLQHTFVRELYAGIETYSIEQAQALRQAYLLLYEPDSAWHQESLGSTTSWADPSKRHYIYQILPGFGAKLSDSSEENVEGKRVWELEGKPLEELVDKAVRTVMEPLRKHIGLLDRETLKEIYDVQHKLLDLKDKAPKERRRGKNTILDVTETAWQFVKADRIAFRLGLIDRTPEERRPDKE